MKFGIAVTNAVNPAVTPVSQAEYVTRVAEATEESGFDSIWVAERTVYPTDIQQRYPDMFGAHHSRPDSQNLLDAVTTLSYVAGKTSRVSLGFNIMVLPFHHPVLNAKMVTSLDALSGGRVIFGVGVGWMKEEFEGMGASYEDRGSVTDEHIEMFKAMCTQDVAEYRGRHFRISGHTFFPKPIQRPHPPIWVGGKTPAALRRAARLGDGWDGIWVTPNQVAKNRKTIEVMRRDYGRGGDPFQVALTLNLYRGEPQFTESGDRLELTGATTDIIDDLRRYEESGLDHAIISVAADNTQATVDAVKRFADEIVPRL